MANSGHPTTAATVTDPESNALYRQSRCAARKIRKMNEIGPLNGGPIAHFTRESLFPTKSLKALKSTNLPSRYLTVDALYSQTVHCQSRSSC